MNMRILVVEDEPVIREMIGDSLAKWGFEPILVSDFEQVMSLFSEQAPGLVILDINLPKFDGYYWCSRIREVSKVPILFLSSRTTPMDMVMAMNMGGDDFIQKPFHMDVLMAKINAMLRRVYSYLDVQTHVIEHQGVLLNLNDGDVSVGEHRAELTKTEFIILNMLMRHAGTIVGRTKMMRSLWADESFIDDNTLTVNIVRIRKKLADLGKKDYIVTKKGQGYLIP
ncbi:DNA-binding response regulator [Paenibacillus cineris]|nr:DNA-binding response regulator [Paenibacillus cineris]